MQEILKKTAAGNYTAESVKTYVKQLKSLYDNDFDELRSRMVTLRDENRRLKEELDEIKAKERYIAATVLKAEQLGQQIRDEAEFQAKKIINEAETMERQAKAHVSQSVEKLYTIQRSVALLLNQIIDTTTTLKETQNIQSPVPKNASEIYQFIHDYSQNQENKNITAQNLAV